MKAKATLEMMDEAPHAPHCLQPMSHLLISSAKTDRQLPGISSQPTRLFFFPELAVYLLIAMTTKTATYNIVSQNFNILLLIAAALSSCSLFSPRVKII